MSEQTCNEDLFCGVNRASADNPDDMSDLEKKHTPVIEVNGDAREGESFEVSVTVGEYLKHPNEHGHFIQFLELYSGETFLGRADFASGRSEPKAVFSVSLDHLHDLRAFEHCNLHGTWEGRKELDGGKA